MKLRDVAKGTWAIQPVTLRLANAVEASQPGKPPSREPVQVQLGVRVLTGEEIAEVYEKAEARARKGGVEKWNDDHPQCGLFKMAFTLAIACVDLDEDPKKAAPFFDGGVEQVLSSPHIGADNIAYLYERWVAWQDTCSMRSSERLTTEEVVAIVRKDMEAPNDPEGPLLRLGHTTLVSCVRIMGGLWLNLLRDRSLYGTRESSDTESGSTASKKSTESPNETSVRSKAKRKR